MLKTDLFNSKRLIFYTFFLFCSWSLTLHLDGSFTKGYVTDMATPSAVSFLQLGQIGMCATPTLGSYSRKKKSLLSGSGAGCRPMTFLQIRSNNARFARTSAKQLELTRCTLLLPVQHWLGKICCRLVLCFISVDILLCEWFSLTPPVVESSYAAQGKCGPWCSKCCKTCSSAGNSHTYNFVSYPPPPVPRQLIP